MAKFDVVDLDLKKVSEIELSDDVFAAEPNEYLIYEVAKMQQINRRRGTVAVKNTSLVSGGGKKPWKQKGTGRARQGSIRATQWKGGGKPFGPTPRRYNQAMPRAARRGALRAAWTDKVAGGQLTVVEQLELAQPKTKALVTLLAGLGAAGTRTLLVVAAPSEALARACQNVPWVTLGRPGHVSVAELLRHDRVVAERRALMATQEGLLA
jgi:large subunit ribosomal protein L4